MGPIKGEIWSFKAFQVMDVLVHLKDKLSYYFTLTSESLRQRKPMQNKYICNR